VRVPAVAIDGETMRVAFSRYDLDAYRLFLSVKQLPESELTYDWRDDRYEISAAARFAPMLGVEVPAASRGRMPIAPHLFDYQRWVVGLALDAKRFAAWMDTGLGKTAVYLEWARQVIREADHWQVACA